MKKLKRIIDLFNIQLQVRYLLMILVLSHFGCERQNTARVKENHKLSNLANQDSIEYALHEHSQPVFNMIEAQKLAEKSNRPLLLFFNSYACVNCRSFENNILNSPEVASTVNQHFILTILFVDDVRPWSDENSLSSDGSDERPISIGQINTQLQLEMTNLSHQPCFVIADSEGNTLETKDKFSTKSEFELWLTKYIGS